ncbi:MAG: hypothetical protein A2X49_12055 [Lentisphaerae bacterium GWF2_52_8]|nr:MAG: hypothetical protein A2X49_12055 [Lentisphaerae bacterium GWF2_52_8]
MTLLSAVITLLLVIDPLGNMITIAPMMKEIPTKRRLVFSLRESLAALLLLFFFLFTGRYLLELLQIKEPMLGIGGGVVLFLISIRMIFTPKEGGIFGDTPDGEPFIVPVATPLLAGPSAIAVVLLLASSNPGRISDWSIALLIVWVVMFFSLLFTNWFARVVGARALVALEKLMGMLLTAMSVQMLATGIEAWLTKIGS